MQLKKSTKIALIVTIALMLISSIGQYLVHNQFFSVDVHYYNVSLEKLSEMIEENNKEADKQIETTFYADGYSNMAFIQFVPKNATSETPAPAVCLFHGGWNTKEKTYSYAIELARRGFVVICPDLAGMGQSDANASGGNFGCAAITEYAMSLPYVDETKIGLYGHSNGNREAARVITLEAETNNPPIKAWFLNNSVGYVRYLQTGCENLFLGDSAAKSDEWDILPPDNTYYFLTDSILAQSTVKLWYSESTQTEFTEGEWISSDGSTTIYDPDVVQGAAIAKDNGIALYNPAQIHNWGAWSSKSVSDALTTYYAALGRPDGA